MSVFPRNIEMLSRLKARVRAKRAEALAPATIPYKTTTIDKR